MLCVKCRNLAQKITDGITLNFQCLACDFKETGKVDDSLIFSEEKNKTVVHRDGRLIFGNDSNPKTVKKCPVCKKNVIVSWEEINDEKVYGCECGCSFNEKGTIMNENKG